MPTRQVRLAPALSALACATFIVSTAGCGSGDSSTTPIVTAVASVTMSRDTATLVSGGTLQLTATPKDAAGTALSGRVVTWSTNASSVATTSTSGLVTAVGIGAATITATSEGKTANTTITVRVGAIIGAAGGTLTSADGNVTIVVPAGALAAATGITAEPAVTFPSSPLLVAGAVYELGPTGTQFAQPVTVRIKYDPTKVPAGIPQKTIQLGSVTQAQWAVIAGSTVDTLAHVIQGTVTHFSPYAGLEPPFLIYKFKGSGPEGEPIRQLTLCVGEGEAFNITLYDPSLKSALPSFSSSNRAAASAELGYSGKTILLGVRGRAVGQSTITVSVGGNEATIEVTVTAASPPCKSVAMASTIGTNIKDDVTVFRNGLLTQATNDGGSSAAALGIDNGVTVPLAYRTLGNRAKMQFEYPTGVETTIIPPAGGTIFGGAFLDVNTFVFPQQSADGTGDLFVAQKGVAGTSRITNLHGGMTEVAASSDGKLYLAWYSLPRMGPEHIFMLPYPGTMLPPATTGLVQVTSGSSAEFQPAISQSNQWLAYSQVDLAFSHSQIMITDVSNPTAAPVAVSPATGFAFSPSWCSNQSVYYVWAPTLNDRYQAMRWDITSSVGGAPVQALAGMNVFQLSIARTTTDELNVCPR